MDNYIGETLMVLFSKIPVAVTTFFGAILSLFFLVLNESAITITVAYAMLFLNILSGWLMMWKDRKGWDPEKWFKSCMKFLWFAILILATETLRATYKISVPIGAFIAGFLTVNEFKGFVDNVGKLMGIDVWNVISDQVDWKKLFGSIKKEDKPQG
tara:strand:- start:59 stop:526 length:468 start_codon:yes stop_codon:yes gene_type:complete